MVIKGDMVTLFATDFTRTNPKVLFTKVVSIKALRGSALLNEIVETIPSKTRLLLGGKNQNIWMQDSIGSMCVRRTHTN